MFFKYNSIGNLFDKFEIRENWHFQENGDKNCVYVLDCSYYGKNVLRTPLLSWLIMNEKETYPTQRKWIRILFLLVPLCLVVLFGCTHEEDYVGTYKCKHEYGEETVTLYPDHSFLQIFADSNGLDSNKGEWRVKSQNSFGLNLLVFDGWMTFKTPFQGKKAKELLGEGEKSIASFYIRSKCIIAEEDFPEFNPCKE